MILTEGKIDHDVMLIEVLLKVALGVWEECPRCSLQTNVSCHPKKRRGELTQASVFTVTPELRTSLGTRSVFDQNHTLMKSGVLSMAYLIGGGGLQAGLRLMGHRTTHHPPPFALNCGPYPRESVTLVPQPELLLAKTLQSNVASSLWPKFNK